MQPNTRLRLKLTEFEENLPARVVPLIQDKYALDKLDTFYKDRQQKIAVLKNSPRHQGMHGTGKKTLITEFCHLVKQRWQVNIKWLDASDANLLTVQLDAFSSMLSLRLPVDHVPDPRLNLNLYERIIFNLNLVRCRSIIVLKNVHNWHETIEKFVLSFVNANVNVKIIIIIDSASKHANKIIKLPANLTKIIDYDLRFSRRDCEQYLGHFVRQKFPIGGSQMTSLVNFLTKNYQKVNPFKLNKFALYIKYNYLYSATEILNELGLIKSFQIGHIIDFARSTYANAFEVLQFLAYLYAECVPIELLIEIFKKDKAWLQNPLKFLNDLGLVEFTSIADSTAVRLNPILQYDVRKFIRIERDATTNLNDLTLKLRTANALYNLFIGNQIKRRYLLSNVICFVSTFRHSIETDYVDSSADVEQMLEYVLKFADICDSLADYLNQSKWALSVSVDYRQLSVDLRRLVTKHTTDHQQLIKSVNNLAGSYFQLDQMEKSLHWYTYMEELCEKRSDNDRQMMQIVLNRAKCTFKLGKYQQAVNLYKRAFDMQAKLAPDPPSVELAQCLTMFAVSYEKTNKHKQALMYHEQALRVKEQLYKTNDHRDVAASLTSLGECSERLNDLTGAFYYYERAFKIIAKVDQYDKQKVADALGHLARLNLKLENYQQALNDFKRIVNMSTNSTGASVECLDYIGVCYARLKQLDLALQYFEDALRLREKYAMSKEYYLSYVNLSLIHGRLNNDQLADELFEKAFSMRKFALEMSEKNNLIKNVSNIEQTWTAKMVKQWLDTNVVRLSQSLIKFMSTIEDGKQLARLYLLVFDNSDYLFDLIYYSKHNVSVEVEQRKALKIDCVTLIKRLNDLFSEDL